MNNAKIYNAALSGALSGMLVSRVRMTSYVAIVAACVTFATAIDNAIPANPGVTTGYQTLMSQLCTAATSNTYTLTIPSAVITQIVSAFNAAVSSLAVE